MDNNICQLKYPDTVKPNMVHGQKIMFSEIIFKNSVTLKNVAFECA